MSTLSPLSLLKFESNGYNHQFVPIRESNIQLQQPQRPNQQLHHQNINSSTVFQSSSMNQIIPSSMPASISSDPNSVFWSGFNLLRVPVRSHRLGLSLETIGTPSQEAQCILTFRIQKLSLEMVIPPSSSTLLSSSLTIPSSLSNSSNSLSSPLPSPSSTNAAASVSLPTISNAIVTTLVHIDSIHQHSIFSSDALSALCQSCCEQAILLIGRI